MLGTKHQELPYPSPTQLFTLPACSSCCCGMAETTRQASATWNKTGFHLDRVNSSQAAILYRDTTTVGAPATTSASLLMNKSITKGPRPFYHLNTDNPRLLSRWFLMKQRTDTHLQKPTVPKYRGNWFSAFSSLNGHPRLLQTPILSLPYFCMVSLHPPLL